MSPRWNWDSPTPLAAREYALPPGPKGGGAHSPAAKGVGESQFQRLEKRTLPTLWSYPILSAHNLSYSIWDCNVTPISHHPHPLSSIFLTYLTHPLQSVSVSSFFRKWMEITRKETASPVYTGLEWVSKFTPAFLSAAQGQVFPACLQPSDRYLYTELFFNNIWNLLTSIVDLWQDDLLPRQEAGEGGG